MAPMRMTLAGSETLSTACASPCPWPGWVTTTRPESVSDTLCDGLLAVSHPRLLAVEVPRRLDEAALETGPGVEPPEPALARQQCCDVEQFGTQPDDPIADVHLAVIGRDHKAGARRQDGDEVSH